MSKTFLLISLTVLACAISPVITNAASKSNKVYDSPAESILLLDTNAWEANTGSKLRFKEKIALKVVKRKLRKARKAKQSAATEKAQSEGTAVLSFIAGLVGLFIPGILLRIVLSLLGIVMGATALARIKREPKKGKGLAIAGLILGVLGIAGTAAIVLAFAAG